MIRRVMETSWRDGCLAGAQALSEFSQEVGEEEVAHPGRLEQAGLGALGMAGDSCRSCYQGTQRTTISNKTP